jgi:poly(3-hydroxybutyrate) depolymerase
MIYQMYQAHEAMMVPVRAIAGISGKVLGQFVPAPFIAEPMRNLAAAYEMIARTGLTHSRPAFGIDTVTMGSRHVDVREEPVLVTPFGTLLHFRKDIETPQPRVLLVAPLSGHFATLLRATVRTMLPEHDVYITDWHNARDVSLQHGNFDLDDSIEHIIRFLEAIGPGAHIVAVCQPSVTALAAAAIMAEDANPAQPRSMTLMAGPVDARVSPTEVNRLAVSRPIAWFERNLIATVPLRYRGARRRVYPGFVQLLAFMSMNVERHLKAHHELFRSLVNGGDEKTRATRAFYDEYFAVLDLPAQFYLDHVRTVFQEYALARGELTWRGRRVEPRAITRTALLTVEGEKDDVCGLGQTLAAHELCSGLRPYRKRHHLQAGVGHYGVFSGLRWSAQIYPVLKNVILGSD